MAIIPQRSLFNWDEVEALGDLERLRLVLMYLPDEVLMRQLEQERGVGRNEYPVRPVWNSILAAVVYQHRSIESLRRELQRNAQLRQLCGFEPLAGERAVPPAWAYTRFLKKLLEHQQQIDEMFDQMVDVLGEVLPEFGRVLGNDGKAIQTAARPPKKDAPRKRRDGRRDVDADWGAKSRKGQKEDGTLYEQVTYWFGYKLHLIVEANYELPVAYEVTKASAAETPQARELYKKVAKRHAKLVEACQVAVADKEFDDTELIEWLWDEHGIKPVIPIRDLWKDGEQTRRVSATRNVVYDYEGTVSCCCMKTGQLSRMAYAGFEKDRETLKYRCPAAHYGMSCPAFGECRVKGSVRIKLDEDRRVFTPLARSSYAWKRAYRKRSAVERVNSRVDRVFEFEEHFIRGLGKMKLRLGLAMLVMLAMAVGRVKEKQKDKLRSLLKAA